MTKTIREFSRIGPCIELGPVLSDTPKIITYQDRGFDGGGMKRIVKSRNRRWQSGLLHIECCRSCRDHPNTAYRDGYMD